LQQTYQPVKRDSDLFTPIQSTNEPLWSPPLIDSPHDHADEMSELNINGTSIDTTAFDFNVSPSDLEESRSVSHLANDDHDLVRLGYNQFSLTHYEEFHLSRENIISELGFFFTHSYPRYPVFHLESLLDTIDKQLYLSDLGFRTLILSIFLLNEATRFRHSPSYGTNCLTRLCQTIETLRPSSDDDHFAEFPSLDAVLVSLFLFIAYSVRDRHNRAFSYLTEAIGLMDLVECPLDPMEAIRFQRLECLLFVTEAASVSIYRLGRKRRIARRPSNLMSVESSMWYLPSDTGLRELPQEFSGLDLVLLDKLAVNLLVAMTRLYGACDATEVANVAVHDNFMSAMIETDGPGPICSVQTADVVLTCQWQLASHWWKALSTKPSPRAKDSAHYTIQIIGMTAIQRSSTLSAGERRIVGHGKLAALADAMFNISSTMGILPACRSVIGDLIRTVSETDYERHFASDLSLIEMHIGEVPRSLTASDASLLMLANTEENLDEHFRTI
jgi:hypothetical protein